MSLAATDPQLTSGLESWKISTFPDTAGFFSPAHGVRRLHHVTQHLLLRSKKFILPIEMPRGVQDFMLIGISIIIEGAAWDFVYHSTYGFVHILPWTSPHLTVTAGFMVLMTASTIGFWRTAVVL